MIKSVNKPMSVTEEKYGEILAVKGEVYCSPKIDGIRGVCTGKELLSSSLKLIPNKYIQSILSKPEYAGLDGELVVGEADDPLAFGKTGDIRAHNTKPDFTFWVFDNWINGDLPFEERLLSEKMIARIESLPFVKLVPQVICRTVDEIKACEKKWINQGFEGLVIRDPKGEYEQGRGNWKNKNMFKVKPDKDCDAKIIGWQERDNRLVGSLGSLRVESPEFPSEFSVGSGFTDEERAEIWAKREELVKNETWIVVKYMPHGSKNAPRHPVFKGWALTEKDHEGE